MKLSRRDALLSTLFGSGYVGLRALATGLPASLLLDPRKALADVQPTCTPKAQYFVFATSGSGDPINASAPGTYGTTNGKDKIVHSADPSMAKTSITLGGTAYDAAAPWATLPQSVLDRTSFWHIMTDTPVHPKEPEVLRLQGTTRGGEMLPSLLAQAMAPCLGTIQAQPITVGATSPSEGLTFAGEALPIIPALALKATLTSPDGPLTKLQPLRDATMNSLYDLYKSGATPAQRQYIDSLHTSRDEVRKIGQDLLARLESIKDNSPASQILAAITLIQMNVTPVVAVHIPFGGDNHQDTGLANESAQTVSGVAAIASLMSQLAAVGYADRVSLVSLNVFGRTLGPGNENGRQHNPNHQVSFAIGKPFRGGVVGDVVPVGTDYGCTPIDSKTGAGTAGGDISAVNTLSAFGQTLLAAVGVDTSAAPTPVNGGTVVSAALA